MISPFLLADHWMGNVGVVGRFWVVEDSVRDQGYG